MPATTRPASRGLLRDLPVQVLARMRSDRVLRRPAPARLPGMTGRPHRHGGEFIFGDPGQLGEPDVTTVTETRLYGTATARAPISVAISIQLTHGLYGTKGTTTSAGDPTTVPVHHTQAQVARTVFSPERAAKRRRQLTPRFIGHRPRGHPNNQPAAADAAVPLPSPRIGMATAWQRPDATLAARACGRLALPG